MYTCKYTTACYNLRMKRPEGLTAKNRDWDSVKDGRPGHRRFLIDDSMTDDVGYSRLEIIM